MGRYGTEEAINQNGKILLGFRITNAMKIENSFYDHGKEPYYTYSDIKMTLKRKIKDKCVEKRAELLIE